MKILHQIAVCFPLLLAAQPSLSVKPRQYLEQAVIDQHIPTHQKTYKNQKIWNYETQEKPQPNSVNQGYVEVSFDTSTNTVGHKAENNYNTESLYIFFKEVNGEGKAFDHPTILFLHGAAFSSQTWEDLSTLEHLRNLDHGYRSVAVDLPGFGNSDGAKDNDYDKALFLQALIVALGIHEVVIVTPSFSGNYAIPYIFDHRKMAHIHLAGLVAVAPVHVMQHYTPTDYKHLVALPALIVYQPG